MEFIDSCSIYGYYKDKKGFVCETPDGVPCGAWDPQGNPEQEKDFSDEEKPF